MCRNAYNTNLFILQLYCIILLGNVGSKTYLKCFLDWGLFKLLLIQKQWLRLCKNIM